MILILFQSFFLRNLIIFQVDSAANEIATIVINKEIDNIFADSLNYYITILQISFQLCDELLDSCIQYF